MYQKYKDYVYNLYINDDICVDCGEVDIHQLISAKIICKFFMV